MNHSDLCSARMTLRITPEPAIQVLLPEQHELKLICSIACAKEDLESLYLGQPLYLRDRDALLICRPGDRDVWFVVSVDSLGFEDSCMVSRAKLRTALEAALRNPDTSP